jgi:hypothetical protein
VKAREIQQLLAAGKPVDHLRIVVPSTNAQATSASKRELVVQISGRRKIVAGELRATLIRRAPAELRAPPAEGHAGPAVVDQVHKYLEILTSEFQETMRALGDDIHVTFDDFQVLSDWHQKIPTGVQDKTDKVGVVACYNCFQSTFVKFNGAIFFFHCDP